MGRRKTRRKVIKKKIDNKLPNTFKCPFCSHESSVECSIDKAKEIGRITCRICDVNYTTEINELTAAIDVYSEWIDQCEEQNRTLLDNEEEVSE